MVRLSQPLSKQLGYSIWINCLKMVTATTTSRLKIVENDREPRLTRDFTTDFCSVFSKAKADAKASPAGRDEPYILRRLEAPL